MPGDQGIIVAPIAQGTGRRSKKADGSRQPLILRPILSPPAVKRACACGGLVARTGRLQGVSLDSHLPAACCRSSVVEHSLGKGEVDSSILSGSTRFTINDVAICPETAGVGCWSPLASCCRARPDCLKHNHAATLPVGARRQIGRKKRCVHCVFLDWLLRGWSHHPLRLTAGVSLGSLRTPSPLGIAPGNK